MEARLYQMDGMLSLNLPRGSKVLRADRTKRLMKNLGFPRYATGSEFRKMPNFWRNEKCKPAILFKETSTGNSYTGENIVDEIAILRASLERSLLLSLKTVRNLSGR